MSTNPSASGKLCPELAPHADLYVASHVAALVEPLYTLAPEEYRQHSKRMHSLDSVLPYLELLKTTSSDSVAISVHIFAEKTVVIIAHDPNVSPEDFEESANSLKRYVRNLQETLASISRMDLRDKRVREEACSKLLCTVAVGCRDRIADSIRRI
ncbi:uncharacterized protein DFL_006366 [Arthrobotrys flagrans]|uniref:Uncharacterized protein n=1 Tax=Arthrobotrys flagrans TaxID=97331 RepID=A0A437A044_ARTFL|nr:hypothetical protein DFL_006366 [Arthrobotrys flagrans]